MSYASNRMSRSIVFTIAIVTLPVVLLVSLFSGCDVRMRSGKRACQAGQGEACLLVGKFYEGKADGIIGFAMSNGATAAQYYGLGCTHGSYACCERLGHITFHGFDSVKDDGYTHADGVDAFAKACVERVPDACSELDDTFTSVMGGSMAEARASRFFLDACNKDGKAEGCYQFARFVTTAHGDVPAHPDLAKKYFAKACAAGDQDGCARSKGSAP